MSSLTVAPTSTWVTGSTVASSTAGVGTRNPRQPTPSEILNLDALSRYAIASAYYFRRRSHSASAASPGRRTTRMSWPGSWKSSPATCAARSVLRGMWRTPRAASPASAARHARWSDRGRVAVLGVCDVEGQGGGCEVGGGGRGGYGRAGPAPDGAVVVAWLDPSRRCQSLARGLGFREERLEGWEYQIAAGLAALKCVRWSM